MQSVSIFEEFDPDSFVVLLAVQQARGVALVALVAVLIVAVLLADPLLVGFGHGHPVSSPVARLGVVLTLARLVRIPLQR